MTAPMPEPMSPREKVARIIDPAAFLFTADELMKGDPSQFNALAKADQIFAALASSGDHAELARLAEANAATTMWHADKALRAIEQICSPDYLLALIAEVAALRGENADLREHRITADLLVSTLKADKEEAERKLAEAVGLLKVASVMFHPGSTVGQDIRALLSKEAERG